MRRGFLLLVALVLCSQAAGAATLRLVSPRRGDRVRGGSFARLEWSAAELPSHAEEWEAFLSLDGGRYYAFRITPHLDLARRSVTWLVPNVTTNDARILIRTGDEQREMLFELPVRFAIDRDERAAIEVTRALGRGRAEAARPGDANVIAWADGDRSGARTSQQSAASPRSQAFVAALADEPAVTFLIAKSFTAAASLTLTASDEAPPRYTRTRAPRIERAFADLLLVCSRWNI